MPNKPYSPHDPRVYRNHGDEISALLEERRKREIEEEIDRWRDNATVVMATTLRLTIWAAAVIVLSLMVFELFAYAIDRAEAMPRYIEGVE